MRKPRVTLRCVAESYNKDRKDSRIIEFFDAGLQIGGLIEFRRSPEGNLLVLPYRLDKDVEVVT